MTRTRDEYDIKRLLDELSDHEGHGTELITVYLPPDTNIGTVEEQIATEHAQAENIKSDRTQKNVQAALSRIQSVLGRYSETPEHGLAIYVGTVDDALVEYVFDTLPRPIPERNYICSNQFDTDALESVLAPTNTYGLIVLDRNEATIGLLAGDRITVERELESGVMGKSKAGGQSQARFQRERERQKHEFFGQIADAAKDNFIEDNELRVSGVLLGGTTITVDDFTSNEYLDYRLRDAILGTYGTSYGNEQGLNELVRKATDVLTAHADMEAKQATNRFFDALSDTSDTAATYGRDAIEQALQYGAVDTLLLAETLDPETVDHLMQLAENTGADTLFVPPTFERGQQLEEAFGGMAAILRYEVSPE